MFCVESCDILGYSHVYWVHFSLECIIWSIVCKHYGILTYSVEISVCYIILYTLDYNIYIYIYTHTLQKFLYFSCMEPKGPTIDNPSCLISLHNYTNLTYLQYFFNWKFLFVLNTQWQVIVSFKSLHFISLMGDVAVNFSFK